MRSAPPRMKLEGSSVPLPLALPLALALPGDAAEDVESGFEGGLDMDMQIPDYSGNFTAMPRAQRFPACA